MLIMYLLFSFIKDCQFNLRVYVRTVHEGEKNFECYLCRKTYVIPGMSKDTSLQFIKKTKLSQVL